MLFIARRKHPGKKYIRKNVSYIYCTFCRVRKFVFTQVIRWLITNRFLNKSFVGSIKMSNVKCRWANPYITDISPKFTMWPFPPFFQKKSESICLMASSMFYKLVPPQFPYPAKGKHSIIFGTTRQWPSIIINSGPRPKVFTFCYPMFEHQRRKNAYANIVIKQRNKLPCDAYY